MAKFTDLYNIAKKFGNEPSAEAAVENTVEAVALEWMNGISKDMQRILQNKSTSRRNKLAQSLIPSILPGSSATNVKVAITTTESYYDFVDKGVGKSPTLSKRGGSKPNPFRNKAPRSPFKFKNVGASKGMIDSIKSWTSFAGANAADAKRIAYFVKRGGIAPKNFIKGAVTTQALSELSQGMTVALGQVVKTQLINYNK
jgi:hypothetical protein